MSAERRLRPSGWDGFEGMEGFRGDGSGLEDAESLDEVVERAADREELMLESLRIAGVGAWELDLASHRLSWSNETFRIFGLEPSSQNPSSELFYSLVHEDDRERMLSRQTRSHEMGTIFDEEYRIVRPDGQVRYLNSRAQVVPRGKGRHNRFLGIVRDVTERRLFEQKLDAERANANRLQADLIHLSRVADLDAMSSALAHELNQPLTSIATYAAVIERMADNAGDPAEIRDMAAALRKSTLRAAEIIRRLRDMTVRGEVTKSVVELDACVREASELALIGVSAPFECSIPAGLKVSADRIQLQQVIVNLLRNAAEALAGKRGARIEIAARQEGTSIILHVRDNGPGIAEAILPKIFESFVSTKAGGMGVGLAISRTIVESHGGQLAVESREGEGTTFTVTLPASTKARAD